ncbi:MAG: formate dehydrogenase subunit gamma [Xanthomonadaceae bacterium]|nr:formate dehydrogenase subunit gamma [Xanthomonadaceae bacterium]
MRKNYLPILGVTIGSLIIASSIFLAGSPAIAQGTKAVLAGHLIADYQKIMSAIVTTDWQGSGQLFIMLQHNLFFPLFLVVLIGMILLFVAHYLFVGAKKFSHEGGEIFYYTVFCRLIHALAALSFCVLAVSGLMIIFGKLFHGSTLVQTARFLHAPAAVLYVPTALILFLLWIKDMLPATYDLGWLLMFGGYLSKKKVTVPAGKFNIGQKFWFWLAVGGGMVMAYTGYYLFTFATDVPGIRLAVIIHNFLGVVLLVMFMIHFYMATFAIKGALKSMLTGRKSAEEVAIMHSKYFENISK